MTYSIRDLTNNDYCVNFDTRLDSLAIEEKLESLLKIPLGANYDTLRLEVNDCPGYNGVVIYVTYKSVALEIAEVIRENAKLLMLNSHEILIQDMWR